VTYRRYAAERIGASPAVLFLVRSPSTSSPARSFRTGAWTSS